MRHIRFTTALLTVSLAVFVVGGAAQKSQENSQNQNTQGQTTPGMMGGGMMGQGMGQGQGGMMSGGMMGGMGQMMTHHQQMSGLMNKLMESMTAIQNEKDPEALKSKLAQHQELLNQMHSHMMQQDKMMQMMSGQIKTNCPAGDAVNKAPAQ
jgi:predicted lipid-binding transport protein (Tim44 family)